MDQAQLNSESASPLYRQLTDRLRSDMATGVYPVGSRLPSEQELCDTYRVSRVTVRKALAELTRDGLLHRMQGKGTFVCAPHIRRDLRDVTSFHEVCRLMGSVPGTQVISARIAAAAEPVRRDLLCGANVVEIVRVRTADGQPVILETNCFPMSCEGLLRCDLTGSIYALLDGMGLEASRGVHEISLCYATGHQAKLLDVNTGDALLQLDQVIYDHHGAPLHTSHQVIRGDRFTFRI